VHDDPIGVTEDDVQRIGQPKGVDLASAFDDERPTALQRWSTDQPSGALAGSPRPQDFVGDNDPAAGQYELHVK
jgi:hypothetical protein